MSRRCKTARDDWQLFAAVNGFAAIPAEPAQLPLPRDAGGGGRRQHADEDAHPRDDRGAPAGGSPLTVGGRRCRAFRGGVRRVKHAARGPVRLMSRSEIPAPEVPQVPPPDARVAGRTRAGGSRPWSLPGPGQRRAVVVCCCLTPRRVTRSSTRGSWMALCSQMAAQ